MKKYALFISLFFITVGFAAVTTSLSINSSSSIKNKLEEFDVYYSDLKVDGVQNYAPIVDPKTFVYTSGSDTIEAVIDYDVTNASKQYDADVQVVCTSENSDVTITNNFDSSKVLEATETRSGTVTLSGSKKWEVTDLDNSGDISTGDEVVLLADTNEKFNVISVNDGKVNMYAKYNLSTTYRQSTTANTDRFSNGTGWEYTPGPKEINIQDYDGPSKTYINNYISYLSSVTGDAEIKGDLITLSQLGDLGCSGVSATYDYFSEPVCSVSPHASWLINKQSTWTKSAVDYTNDTLRVIVTDGSSLVWYIDSSGYVNNQRYTSLKGIRPVVTVSMSKLSPLDVTCKIEATSVENDVVGNEEVAPPLEPMVDPQTFCQSKGYSYGMFNVQTYSSNYTEMGDISEAVYLCSNEEDYSEYYAGYDAEGNWVYEWMSNLAEV